MLDMELINDPEYRWYHKEELSDIMPYYSKRKELGIIPLNYDELREEFLKTIKSKKSNDLDWVRFKWLVDCVPYNLDRSIPKTKLQPKDMLHFEKRDKCTCYLCGTVSIYTELHHIIPNMGNTDDNIVTLCEDCHNLVHLALYKSGKSGYVRGSFN